MKYNTQLLKLNILSRAAMDSQVIAGRPTAKLFAFLLICILLLGNSDARAQQITDPQTPDAVATSPLAILHAAPTVHIEDQPQFTPAVPVYQGRHPVPAATPAPEKKPGLMRSMLHAIPFIGPRMVGNKETPAPPTDRTMHDQQMEDTTETPAPAVDQNRLNLQPDVTPGAPTYAPSYVFPDSGAAIATPAATPASSVLSVKIPGEIETTSPTAEITKKPQFATSINSDVISTSTASESTSTSPSIEAADLGMPNPTYEQNDSIRSEYVEAVQAARTGNYSHAAQLFRDYATNHGSSGLTPRALFLAALLEPATEKSQEAEKGLRERFPKSRFLAELEKRNRARAKSIATPTPISNEPPAQLAARLETELTESVGNMEREVPLRLKLGQAYLALEEYERALEVMRPAAELSRGRTEEADILILISECYIATRRNAQAVTLLSDVLQRFPAAPQRPRALYDFGLVNEASGNFERARTMYSELRQRWPASAEAAQAVQRLRDMDRLAE